eukprot:Opistho-2@52011
MPPIHAVPLPLLAPRVFVTAPSERLRCVLCGDVFSDPVIAQCGHSFCRGCVVVAAVAGAPQPGSATARGQGTLGLLREPPCCPTDGTALSPRGPFIPNIIVAEQVAELLVHCRHGCIQRDDGSFVVCDAEDEGCPAHVRLGARDDHEAACEYAPVGCPYAPACGAVVRKKNLHSHVMSCAHAACPHKQRGCTYLGHAAAVEAHAAQCPFAPIDVQLVNSGDRLGTIAAVLGQREEEIAFLRSVLVRVSERVDRNEREHVQRMSSMEDRLAKMVEIVEDFGGQIALLKSELSHVHGKLGAGDADARDVMPGTYAHKCKGTFVGHLGPVWALAVDGDYLYSGSSDTTIKVWDHTSFKCKATLEGHTDIVHALCIRHRRLYSGSSDFTIKVWDLDTHALRSTLEGHTNIVYNLAIARGKLFSGSHKIIKVWDLETHHVIKDLSGLNHWVRALTANETHLYSGCYKSVFIWSLESLSLLRTLEMPGGSVYSLAITPKLLISGTYENSIHVYDIDNHTHQAILEGHGGTIYALAVMGVAGQSRLFSGSYDNTIKVWNLETYQLVQTLVRHGSCVDTLAVAKGRLFSGSADNSIKVWL